jgi:hypothetical protein
MHLATLPSIVGIGFWGLSAISAISPSEFSDTLSRRMLHPGIVDLAWSAT